MLDAAMYGHAEPSSRHTTIATGAHASAPATSATAVAACVSSLPESDRFQAAWTNAAATASSSASSGMRGTLRAVAVNPWVDAQVQPWRRRLRVRARVAWPHEHDRLSPRRRRDGARPLEHAAPRADGPPAAAP